MKYHTHQHPPRIVGESFVLPSETRESDYVSLENLFERFRLAGYRPKSFVGAQGLSDEEKEALYDGADETELAEADLTEQRAFADAVLKKVLKQQDKKEEPKQAEPAAEQPAKAEKLPE